jgi:hypothetical protein
MYSQKYPVRKPFASQCSGAYIGLVWGSATDVVAPEGTDASSDMSKGKSHSAHASIIDGGEQVIVSIYYINENNLYCYPHVQLDIGEEKLIAVLDTGTEISLTPEGIFERL